MKSRILSLLTFLKRLNMSDIVSIFVIDIACIGKIHAFNNYMLYCVSCVAANTYCAGSPFTRKE